MTARLFVAAWPDASTRAALGALPRPAERGVRWVDPRRWHVTLCFLGDVDADAATDRLLGARLPQAVARLGPAVTWLGNHLVVPVAGVDGLADAVHLATAGIGGVSRNGFAGHLTVGRCRGRIGSSVLGHAIEASFTVAEIALVSSDVTADGPAYTTLATFPTAPG